MSYSLEEKVKQFAILSRLGIITLQFLTNILISDHNAEVFQKPLEPNSSGILDSAVEFTFQGLTRWDAQYFLHIAQYGYTYENTLAFFPLFPLIIRYLGYFTTFISRIFQLFIFQTALLSSHNALVLVSVLFNNFIFVKTAVVLFQLSTIVLKSQKLGYISSILFCVNPASIFFSAAYSESLYCFLTFYGLLIIERGNSLVNYIVIGLTGVVRSNGVVNIGFLLYKYLKLKCTTAMPFFYYIILNLGVIVSILPFLNYQFYCYAKFCLPNAVELPDFIYKHGKENRFVFPGSNSSWCEQAVPFAYSYVQKHYWNVGFLKYYELKQLPNFLLAVPMIYIIFRGVWTYVKHHKLKILYLGFIDTDHDNKLPLSAFPYIIHGFALTIFAIFIIHIQVTTRLLASSSPLLYWFSSQVIAFDLKKSVEEEVLGKLKKKDEINYYYYEKGESKKSIWKTFLFSETFSGYSFFIKWYFLAYFFAGTLMFSNYLPWT